MRPMGRGRPPHMPREKQKGEKLSSRSVIKNNFWMLGRIFRYTPGYVILMVIEGIVFGINSAIEVVYTKNLLNSLTNGATFEKIMQLILIYTVYRTVYYAWNQWYWQVYNPQAHEKMHIALHSEMFIQAVSLDLCRYDDPEFYNDFIWSMDRAYERAVQLMEDTGRMLGRIVSTAAITGVMYSIDPWMAVLAIILAGLRVLLAYLRNQTNLKFWDESNILFRKNEYIKRVFMLPDYAKELRATRVTEPLYSEYQANTERQIDVVRKYKGRFTVIGILLSFVWLAGEMGMFLYVLYNVMVTKSIDIGAFAVAINGLWKMSWMLRDFVDRLLRYHEHGIFIEKVVKFKECRPSIVDGAETAAPLESIEIKNLTFFYGENAEIAALKDVSLKINKGERIAIVGYNGAGKTTLTKLLLRLYDASEGEVLYNGKNVKDYTVNSLRSRVAAVFQDYRIFASTIAENVTGGEYDDGEHDRVESALRKSTFTDKLNSLPDGLLTPLTREFYDNGTVLSGGEQQKVAIARAFYKDADLIILDEPSSALDPDAEYELNRAISQYAEDKTVIFISHRLSTTRHADRIYMFDGGTLAECGSHEELIAQGGKYAYMFNLQAEKYRKQE